MALVPIAHIPPGCSGRCTPNVVARSGTFAYGSTRSIALYGIESESIPASASMAADTTADASGGTPMVSVTTLRLRTIFGSGVFAAIAAFDYNDEYMACLTAEKKAVYLWSLRDAEPLTAKKLPPSLFTMFRLNGKPTTFCIAGRYHLIFGTNAGTLISLNMNDGAHEPRCVAIPPPPAAATAAGTTPKSPSATNAAGAEPYLLDSSRATSHLMDDGDGDAPAVETVQCVVASPLRPDILACGTEDGTLCFMNLSPTSGLRITASVQPFSSAASPERRGSSSSRANTTALMTTPSPVSMLAFSSSAAQLLVVASTEGALAAYDASTGAAVQSFEYKHNCLSGVAWLLGDASVFFSVAHDSNRVTKWSMASKTPVAELCPVEEGTGIRGVACLDAEHLVLGLTSGAVVVYHLTQQRVEFETEAGHTDAVCDTSFSRHDRDLIASGGVDGTIRVWNLRQLSRQFTIEVGQAVVSAVAWSPNGKYVAAALGSGEVAVFTCSTQRVLWREPFFSDAAAQVAWSTGDSSVLAAVSLTGGVVLIHAKEGKATRRYATPAPAYCASFEPTKGKQLAVGCQDHRIYIYHPHATSGAPALVLTGHTETVSAVAFHPSVPSFVLSGSYDCTARVWDVSSGDAHTASVSSRMLKGHGDRIRSVAWCGLAPFIALTGCADGSIRVWDIRNGVAVTSVRSHNSDVRALVSHADRPLVFLSAAADGSLVFWNLSLLRQVYLDAALGAIEQNVVADPAALMALANGGPLSVTVIAGATAQKMVRELRDAASPAERMERAVGFFDFPCGAADVAHACAYLLDPSGFSAGDTKVLVVPPAKLSDAVAARAKQKADRAHGRTVAACGPPFRAQRLVEAAEAQLRCGKLKEACGLLLEARAWEQAVALAPMISRAYWREVCITAAEAMEAAGDARAVNFFIMAEESARAAQLLARWSVANTDAATVVAQTCPQRKPDASAVEGSAGQLPSTAAVSGDASPVVLGLQNQRHLALARYHNPRLFVAQHVLEGDTDSAIRLLRSTGDVSLAHLLAHTVPLREQTSIDAAYRLSMLQSARQRQWETALICAVRQSNAYDSLATVLALFQQTQWKQLKPGANGAPPANTEVINEKLKGFYAQVAQECGRLQLPLDATTIHQRHASDGLASQNQIAAMILSADPASGPATSALVLQSINGFLISLLDVTLQDADGANAAFYLKQALCVVGYVSLPVVPMPPIPAASLSVTSAAASSGNVSAMTPEARQLLALAYLLATLFCVKVYRFPKLLNPAFTRARDVGQADPAIAALLNKTQAALGTYSAYSAEVRCAPLGMELPSLLSDGKLLTSCLTQEPIHGAVHLLEDGTSAISKEEALAWSLCCPFSPLPTGARLIPY